MGKTKTKLKDMAGGKKFKVPSPLALGKWLAGVQKLVSRSQTEDSSDYWSDVGAVKEDFAVHASLLEETIQSLDKEFSHAAQSVGELGNMSEKLVRAAEKLLSIALGKEDHSLLERSAETLFEWLQRLNENQEKTTRLLDSLDRQSDLMAQVLHFEDTLQRASAPLKIFPALLKIEASTLPIAKQQFFVSLASEITSLKERVSESLDKQFRFLEGINRTVVEGIKNFCGPLREQCHLISERKAEIEKTLEAIRDDLKKNHERDVTLLDVTRRIEGSIAKAIMALQYQDISGQQLSHVVANVQEMRSGVNRVKSKKVLTAKVDQAQFLHEAGLIQSAQIQVAQSELNKARLDVNESFGTVVSALRELDESCISMQDSDSITVSADGIVQRLLDGKQTVEDLNSTFVAGISKVYEFIKPLEGTAANLTSAMRGSPRRFD